MKKISIVLIILCVAAFLRLYKLGVVPASPDWDEAAIGYNAYSILKTGRDEYGKYLPFTFRSFNDYKPPVYVYLTVPSVAVFGLDTFAVRLPSAIAGILAVLGMYFLTIEMLRFAQETGNRKQETRNRKQDMRNRKQEITSNKQETKNIKNEKLLVSCFMFPVPYIASLLLAISPWHLQFSRVGFESNVALTFIIWGVWAFLRGMRDLRVLPIASIFLVLSMYTYHTPRLFVPLFGLSLLILFYKEVMQHKKAFVATGILTFVLLAPLIFMTLDKTTLSRLSGTSIFTKQTDVLSRSVRYLIRDQKSGLLLGQIVNNRRVEWTKVIFSGYISHFSPKWLFVIGDQKRHHAPDMGLLYLIELPFLLIGLIAVYKMRDRVGWIIVIWLLIAPIASTVTFETPHAVRAYVLAPMLIMITAIGIQKSFEYIVQLHEVTREQTVYALWNHRLLISVGVIVLAYMINMSYYFSMYYVAMNLEYASYWQFGYKEAIKEAKDKSEGQVIHISNTLEQPYIYTLFYTAYDPTTYLADGGSSTHTIKGYSFIDTIDWKNATGLFIGKPDEIPDHRISEIRDPGGNIVMVVGKK